MGNPEDTIVKPPDGELSRQGAVLDICERAFVFVVFTRFAWFMLTGAGGQVNFLDVLLVIAEAIPFVLILLRPPSETLSRHFTDWVLGVGGVTLPLLVRPAAIAPLISPNFCFAVMVLGTFVQLAAKIALGRSFGVIAANRGVVTQGPYRFIRHPMYMGYTITHIGFLLSNPSLVTVLLYVTTFAVQVLRLMQEERVLMRDAAYRAFAERVRFRILPGVF